MPCYTAPNEGKTIIREELQNTCTVRNEYLDMLESKIKYWEYLFCKACKKISNENIKDMQNNNDPGNILYHYSQHLFNDYNYNSDPIEKESIKNELERIGYKIIEKQDNNQQK